MAYNNDWNVEFDEHDGELRSRRPSSCTSGLPCSVSTKEYQDIFDRASIRRERAQRRGITGQQVPLLDDLGYHIVLATLDWVREKQNAGVEPRRDSDPLLDTDGLCALCGRPSTHVCDCPQCREMSAKQKDEMKPPRSGETCKYRSHSSVQSTALLDAVLQATNRWRLEMWLLRLDKSTPKNIQKLVGAIMDRQLELEEEEAKASNVEAETSALRYDSFPTHY